MQVHEIVFRLVDGVWQVRFDSRIVSSQPTQMDALAAAQALAHAGALRGERSRIEVGDLDGDPIEDTAIGQAKRRA